MPQGVLGGEWAGMRLDVAPYLLSGVEAQSCQDIAPQDLYGAGVLAARRGRVRRYNNTNTINGVCPLNFPWANGRIICDTSGTWTVVNAPAVSGVVNPIASFAQSYLTSLSCSAGALVQSSKTITVTNGVIQSAV